MTAQARKQVLIVDDDEMVRSMIACVFADMGYFVVDVEQTALAQKWLESNRPALIIADIMMPDGNGLDFCRWLGSRKNLAGVPFFVSSALGDEETIQDALELGATAFIPKPIDFAALKEKIDKLDRA